jgi:Zn-dependent protease
MEDYLLRIMLLAPPVLLALTAHECAHAWVAERLGDNTARMLGRVTLNPLKHLDPIGTLAIFITGLFGWAKPVPVNPRNFKNPSRDMMWVAIAGPITNLFLAAIFAVILKLMMSQGAGLSAAYPGIYEPLFIMALYGVTINIALAIFNMLPVPPLDGSKVLFNFLPPEKALAFARVERYGFLILIVLIMTGAISQIMSPVIKFTVSVLIGGFG